MAAALDPNDDGLSRKTAEAVDLLAADAVHWVTAEIANRQTGSSGTRDAGGGPISRLQTEQYLDDHIEVLCTALATGRSEFFTDHVTWLASVLRCRGVPTKTLRLALDLFDRFLSHSLNPAHAVIASDVLMQGRRVLAEPRDEERTRYVARRPSDLPQVGALTRMLANGDVGDAREVVQKAWESSGSYADVATRLVQPALYDVGMLWQRNDITVAQEHLATAMSEMLLSRLFLTATLFVETSDQTALFACAAGNHHSLGLRIVSDAFELAGWTVQYLGANTPTDALVAQVDGLRPDVVGMSASMAQQLPTLRRAVEAIRAELGAQCPTILVGGLPTNQVDGIWRWVGSDAWSPDAATTIRELG